MQMCVLWECTFSAQYWCLLICMLRSLYRSSGVNMMLKGPAQWLKSMNRLCLSDCWGNILLLWCTAETQSWGQFKFNFSLVNLFQWPLTLWPAVKRPCLCVPGTFCMMLATRALKWERMSLSVSESLSFSASRSCRVRSTYSSRVLFREWDSPSRPPLALHRQSTN